MDSPNESGPLFMCLTDLVLLPQKTGVTPSTVRSETAGTLSAQLVSLQGNKIAVNCLDLIFPKIKIFPIFPPKAPDYKLELLLVTSLLSTFYPTLGLFPFSCISDVSMFEYWSFSNVLDIRPPPILVFFTFLCGDGASRDSLSWTLWA